MATFVSDCIRCGSKNQTHDVYSSVVKRIEYDWKQVVEIACICRACHRLSVQVVERVGSAGREMNNFFGGLNSVNSLSSFSGSLNDIVDFVGHTTVRDRFSEKPPDHLPEEINTVVEEGNSCRSAQCFNAAGAMFRLAIDMASKALLPEEGEPNSKIRRSLGHRLQWLFDNGKLPKDLHDLADCIKEDGNDGAHEGTLTKAEAEDLHDFCVELLRRLYSEPARLQLAKERRAERRGG